MGLCTFKSPWDSNKNVLWAMFHEALYIFFLTFSFQFVKVPGLLKLRLLISDATRQLQVVAPWLQVGGRRQLIHWPPFCGTALYLPSLVTDINIWLSEMHTYVHQFSGEITIKLLPLLIVWHRWDILELSK